VARVLILGILGLLTWESRKKCHLGVTPMVNHIKYYKKEGGGFPQVRAMVDFMSLCMLMIRLCSKSAPIMH